MYQIDRNNNFIKRFIITSTLVVEILQVSVRIDRNNSLGLKARHVKVTQWIKKGICRW